MATQSIRPAIRSNSEALSRATTGLSMSNYPTIYGGLVAKGIPESEITELNIPTGVPLLYELDQELERRGHRFVRYADDCNIYVGSERAGQRVMESVTHFITHRLKLKVNQAKSAVAFIHW